MKKAGNEKGSEARQTRSAGLPPAYFLHALAPGASGLRRLVRATENDRAPFRSKRSRDIFRQTFHALVELAARVATTWEFTDKRTDHGTISSGLANPAEELAALAVTAANLLHDLAYSDLVEERTCITLAASRHNSWPVLLRLSTKTKDGERLRALEGARKAKEYLSSIRLGEDCPSPLRHLNDFEASLFRKAAELLLHELHEFPQRGAWRYHPALKPGRSKLALWAEKLCELKPPMTADNVDRWWSVAKPWMDDQWKNNHQLFEPLIAACKSKGKSLAGSRHDLYQSEVRRTVIDVRLREAFFGLVKPTDL